MLADKCLNDLIVIHGIGVLRKMIVIAQVPAATNHHEVHARHMAFARVSDHICVAPAHIADILFFAYCTQRRNLIAMQRSIFVLLCRRGSVHARDEIFDHLIFLARQEQRCTANILRVFSLSNVANARRGAAAYLVHQARARTVGEDAILAIADAEYLL